MSSIKVHIENDAIMNLLILLDCANRFFSLSDLNYKVVYHWSDINIGLLLGVVIWSIFYISLTVIIPESGISEGLINFSLRSFQGLLSFSFNPIKFTPDVFSDMPRIFQEDIPLSGILFSITFSFSGVIKCIQSLALVNFGIPLDSLRSLPSGNIVYIKTNSTTFLDEGALSKLFVFWINVLIRTAVSHSNILGILYILR